MKPVLLRAFSCYNNPMNEEIPFVRKALEFYNGRGREAIDLGCGYGRNALYLEKCGFDVTAVDVRKKCLDEIRKSSRNIVTINDDVTKIKFEKKYDFILCTFLLHFFEKRVAINLLKNMVENLAKDGVLAIALIKKDRRISVSELRKEVADLKVAISAERVVHDGPHEGMEYPHDHDIFYFVGVKK